jgi:hypothetical protein
MNTRSFFAVFALVFCLLLVCAAAEAGPTPAPEPTPAPLNYPVPGLQEEAWKAQIVSSIVQSVIAVASVLVLILNLKTIRGMKRTDVAIEDHRRYDAMLQLRNSVNCNESATQAEVDDYYLRFWNLQYDQFEHWRDGMVKEEVFIQWLMARYVEYQANKLLIDGHSRTQSRYQEGWQTAKRHYLLSGFTDFMDTVFAIPSETDTVHATRELQTIIAKKLKAMMSQQPGKLKRWWYRVMS